MSELAIPTPGDRAITRAKAQRILENVTNDDWMFAGLDIANDQQHGETDLLIFDLSQEVVALRAELAGRKAVYSSGIFVEGPLVGKDLI